MSKMAITKGTTGYIANIRVQQSNSSTMQTGLAYNTSGLKLWYKRQGDTALTQITLVNTTVGVWASGGFKEVDSTNAPGLYEVGIPNACLASGSKEVYFELNGVSGVQAQTWEYQLNSFDTQDGVRGGLTALPNAAASASGGLLTAGTGTNQLNPSGGTLASTSVTTVASGTAQAGGASTITLQAGSSATTDLYKGNFIVISSGTGAGQSRVITGYIGGTLVATVSRAWTVQPDNTSVYSIIANPHPAMDANLAVVLPSTAPSTFLSTDATIAALPSAAAIWAAGTRTLTAQSDSAGVTTLLTRVPQTFLFDGAGNVRSITYAYNTGQDPAALVLNATASSYNTAGSIGNKINAAASAGDPWTAALPGSYASGSAGNILGNRLDAAVSTRQSGSSAVTLPTTPPAGYLASDVITALKADAQWKLVLSHAAGKFTFDPNAGTLALYDTDGTTVLKTLTLTVDGSKNVTLRA